MRNIRRKVRKYGYMAGGTCGHDDLVFALCEYEERLLEFIADSLELSFDEGAKHEKSAAQITGGIGA